MRTLQIAVVLALCAAGPAMAGVTLTPADDSFTAGTDIVFTVENGTAEGISFGSSAPYELKNLDTGESISFIGLTVVIPLAAYASREFTIPGDAIDPGRYEIELAYFDKDYGIHLLSAEITVTSDDAQTPGQMDSIGRAKSRYRHE